MNETVIGPHGFCEQLEAKVTTIGSYICMIRRNEGFLEQVRRRQSCCTKDDRVDQMNNVRLKLLQAAYEQGAKEVKL